MTVTPFEPAPPRPAGRPLLPALRERALPIRSSPVVRVLAPVVRRSLAVAAAGLATEYALRALASRALGGSALSSLALPPATPPVDAARTSRHVVIELVTIERRSYRSVQRRRSLR